MRPELTVSVAPGTPKSCGGSAGGARFLALPLLRPFGVFTLEVEYRGSTAPSLLLLAKDPCLD